MFQYINVWQTYRASGASAASFATAKSYRYIVCNDLLVPGCGTAIAAAFPDAQWVGWDNIDHQYQQSQEQLHPDWDHTGAPR
jgi:hypothetical protein